MIKTLKQQKWCLTYLYKEGQVSTAFKAFAMQSKYLYKFEYSEFKNPDFEFLELYNLEFEDLPATVFNYVLPY